MTTPLDRIRPLLAGFAKDAGHWDKTCTYPHKNVHLLTEAGLMGATIPTDLGGRGESLRDLLPAIEAAASVCTLTARILVEGNVGALTAVMTYGTEAQRAHWAKAVLEGDKPAICITEPGAGSDATAMTTRATKVAGGWLLNGTKHWITGGGVSRMHLVFAQTDDGIRGFLTEPGPGLTVTRRETTMGLRGMPEAELRFTDHFVPADGLIPNASFKELMAAYNAQRVGAGTVALGVARGAMDHARDYLLTRHQFDRPLADFQGLQWMLADMDVELAAARLMLRDAAKGDRLPNPAKAARSKLLATETAIRVVDRALQMHGAIGYSDQTPLERMYRDVRMFTIGGGTAQVLRNQIAAHVLGRKLPQRAQGFDRPGQADIAAE